MARITTAIRERVESILNSGVGTVNADSVNTGESTLNFLDGSAQSRVPIVPSDTQSGEDTDDTTALDFDFSVDDYSEYIISIDAETFGSGTEDIIQIGVNGIADNFYKQVEFDSDVGISEFTGDYWRLGFFSGGGRSYRTLLRLESNNEGNGQNLVSFAPFTAIDTTQPTPFSGFHDSAGGTNVDDINSIQISTNEPATASVTIIGIKGIDQV